MGRRRQNNHGLPPRMHKRGNAFYYVTSTVPRKWEHLGVDLPAALIAWAHREGQSVPVEQITLSLLGARYEREILPTLRDRTQKDYVKHLRKLHEVFGHMPLAQIRPVDVAQYVRLRGHTSQTQANREKAVLSILFNFARSVGYWDGVNPCIGVRGHKETARKRYVTNEEFDKLHAAASWPVQDAMELALLTGQRVADVLSIQLSDVGAGVIALRQSKTGKALRINLTESLLAVVTRIQDRIRRQGVQTLLVDELGHALTVARLRTRFEAARHASGVDFRFTDLRAKAATDLSNLQHAQSLLGHRNRSTTEIYVRDRLGELVQPLR